jgi:hypothetical protein
MSLYNDPRYFQRFRADLKTQVKAGSGFKGGQDLKTAFEFFKDGENFNQLGAFKLNP